MKSIYIAALLGIFALAAGAPSAYAACACACIEGEKRSVCNNMSEAAAGQNMCKDGPQQRDCPAVEGAIDANITVSTPEGAVNCERARVWNPADGEHGAYKLVNICGLAG